MVGEPVSANASLAAPGALLGSFPVQFRQFVNDDLVGAT